jgi:uncharacterized RDD family membrane protein YckC
VLAGRLVRFASLLYEGILLVQVVSLAAYLFLAVAQDARTGPAHTLFQAWLVMVCGGYFVYCWVKGGRTLAMKTWHLKLAQADGTAVGWRRAWLRYALAVPGLFLLALGFWWAFIDRDGQFLHDRLAGTRIYSSSSHREDTKARRKPKETEERARS